MKHALEEDVLEEAKKKNRQISMQYEL